MTHLPRKEQWCAAIILSSLLLALPAIQAFQMPRLVAMSQTLMNNRNGQIRLYHNLDKENSHVSEPVTSVNDDDALTNDQDTRETAAADGSTITRRRALSETALTIAQGVAISSSWNNPTLALAADDDAPNGSLEYQDDIPRTILITGCNSGIGYNAARRFAARGHSVILACRTLEKATDTARRITEEQVGERKAVLIPGECNLASLGSVQSFVTNVVKPTLEESKTELDVVCLNAGVARNVDAKDILRTKEGFELTVGTNHLGHFYLHHLLLPMVKKQTGRFVITASAVHDPDSPGGAQGKLATLGDIAGLEAGPRFDMVDGGEFNADKAYKDSKLCNVFFTRELQRRLDASGSGIKANCFSPGLIVGTGLFRDQNPLFTKVFDIAATNLLKVGESVEWGGGALEFMALQKTMGSGNYYAGAPGASAKGENAYGSEFKVKEVSKEALDDAKGRRLWALSEKLVGIAA